jgi:hypothetical protein
MSIFDDIRKDREAGTPGEFKVDSYFMPDGHPLRVAAPDENGVPSATIAECFADWEGYRLSWKNAEANARRIARVPRLERIALAAEELAEAVQRSEPWEDIDDALAAFRAACGEGE